MQKTLIIVFVLSTVAGCSRGKPTHTIADVAKAETITLQKGSSQGDIHYMTVVGTGYLDGTAEIVLILDGKPYKTEKLSGDVAFEWSGDWYSNSASIEYNPASVKSGSLSLQYTFKDM